MAALWKLGCDAGRPRIGWKADFAAQMPTFSVNVPITPIKIDIINVPITIRTTEKSVPSSASAPIIRGKMT